MMKSYVKKSGRTSALIAIAAILAFAVPFIAFELNSGYYSAESNDGQTDLSYSEITVSDNEESSAEGAMQAELQSDYILTITFVGNGTVDIINGDDGKTLIDSVTGMNGEEKTVTVPISVGSIHLGAINAPPHFFKQFVIDEGAPSTSKLTPTSINDDMNVVAEFSTIVSYIDADGSTKTYNECIEINAGNSGLTSLTAGWYYVTENVTIISNLIINGDVTLIIANGVTMRVNGQSGISVQTGNLAVFSQPPAGESAMGLLFVQSSGIVYSGSGVGRIFTNTANIESSLNISVAATVTNGVTGTIHKGTLTVIVLAAGSTINNYNSISGSISTSGSSSITINNYAGKAGTNVGGLTLQIDCRGHISSTTTTIQLGAGSHVNNWGTIIGNNTGITSKDATGGVIITNNQGGVIQGTSYAIYNSSTGSGSSIANYGRIVGGNYAIYTSGSVAIFNGSYVSDPVCGVIETTSSGSAIYLFSGNNTVSNSGKITGVAHGIYATVAATYINNTEGEITGRGGDGICMMGGGSVTNKGTITGTAFGIRANAVATLVNIGVIKGVTLGNYANNVTFTVGSKITGDFIIGPNARATLHFRGSDDLPILGADLTFSTVTGNFNIGKGTATVTFDPLAVPSGARTLTLIGGGTATADSYPREPAMDKGHMIYIKDNKDLIATSDFFTVTVGDIVGSGTIQWSLDGTNWSGFVSPGNKNFAIVEDEPKIVHLRAVPGTGFVFSLWKNDIPYGGSNPYEHTSEKSVTVGVEFVDTAKGILDKDYFTVTVGDIVGSGRIMWSLEGTEWFDFPSEGYKVLSSVAGKPKTVHLKAVPNDGFDFSLWKNDVPYGADNPCEYAGEKSITAGAEFIDTESGTPGVDYFTMTLSDIVGDGKIMWSLDGAEWFDFPSCGYKIFGIVSGQPRVVYLEAVPGGDSEFSIWTGTVPYGAENPYEHTSEENFTVGAEFVDTTNGVPDVDHFTVSFGDIVGDGTIVWSLDGIDWFDFPSNGYKAFSIVSGQPRVVYLEAVPGSGFEFSLWKNDIPYGGSNPYEHVSEKSVTAGAEFVDTENGTLDVDYFTMTLGDIVGDGKIMWSLDGIDWFDFPSEGYKVFSMIAGEPKTICLKALSGSGFEFSLWKNDIQYGAENPYEHAEEKSITVGAEFVDTANGVPGADYFTMTLGDIVGDGKIMWSLDGIDWFDFPSEGYKVFSITSGQPRVVYTEAVPGGDSEFSLWKNDIPYGAENPYEHTSEENFTVGAEFVDTLNGVPGADYFIVTFGDIVGDGTIVWSLNGKEWFDFPSDGYKVFSIVAGKSKTIHLKALPNDDFEFSLWKNDMPYGGSNPYKYTSEESITVGAEFIDTENGIIDVDYFTMTLTLSNIVGDGTIMWSLDCTEWFNFPPEGYKVFSIAEGQSRVVYLEAVPGDRYEFSNWTEDIPRRGGNPYEHAAEKSITIGAKFDRIPKDYFITATADSGSTVSPAGQEKVIRGNSYTVSFSALNGCMIYSVLVDGRPVPQDVISRGYYTFTNVMMNHTIEVLSTDKIVTLEVNIAEGKGHVEYSTDGKTFHTYTTAVQLPANTYLSLAAYGDDGYKFKEWDTAAATYTSSAISFEDVTASIYIEVHFALPGGSGDLEWTLLLIAALMILVVLALLLLLLYRRRSHKGAETAGL